MWWIDWRVSLELRPQIFSSGVAAPRGDCRSVRPEVLFNGVPGHKRADGCRTWAVMVASGKRRRLGAVNKPFGQSRSLCQPQEHVRALNVVVDEFSRAIPPRPTVEPRSVVLRQPPHPVLFLSAVPGLRPMRIAPRDLPFQVLGDGLMLIQLRNDAAKLFWVRPLSQGLPMSARPQAADRGVMHIEVARDGAGTLALLQASSSLQLLVLG